MTSMISLIRALALLGLGLLVLAALSCNSFATKLPPAPEFLYPVADNGAYAPGLRINLCGTNIGTLESINPFNPPTVVQGYTVQISGITSRIIYISENMLGVIVPLEGLPFKTRQSNVFPIRILRNGVTLRVFEETFQPVSPWLANDGGSGAVGFVRTSSAMTPITPAGFLIPSESFLLTVYASGWGYGSDGFRTPLPRGQFLITDVATGDTVGEFTETYSVQSGPYGTRLIGFEWPLELRGRFTIRYTLLGHTSEPRYVEAK